MKLTEWYPAHIKPKRRGVYETRFSICDELLYGFSKWTGEKWANQYSTAEIAANASDMNAIQRKKWRGIATQPHKGTE